MGRGEYPQIELDLDTEELIRRFGLYWAIVMHGLDSSSMSPKVYSESGQLIYAGVTAPQKFIQEADCLLRPGAYAELLRRIQPGKDPIKVSPLIVKALKVTDSTETSVVISDYDAEAILNALNTYDFLAQYSVIFLVD